MFLLRCVFWLAIVYASMSWTREDLAPGDWIRAPASPGALAGVIADRATRHAAAVCRHEPARCVTESARLTALIDGTEDTEATRDTSSVGPRPPVPLPIADPRRHGRAGMQTPAR